MADEILECKFIYHVSLHSGNGRTYFNVLYCTALIVQILKVPAIYHDPYQELAELHLVINVKERKGGGRKNNYIPKERRDKILKRSSIHLILLNFLEKVTVLDMLCTYKRKNRCSLCIVVH